MAYDNRDPAYVPSQQALAVDAYIASSSPETHPDEYTYYPGYGNTYTGPMANYTSGTEYNTWLNSSLFGGSMFGSGQEVVNFYNDSSDLENVETLLNDFPNAQDTATYLPETNFPSLNADSANATVNSTSNNLSQVSVSDVNTLYNDLLGRSGADNFLQDWVNTGASLEEIAAGIANSPEGQAYAASQSSTTTESTSTTASNEEITASGQCNGNDFVVTYSNGTVETVPNYGHCLNGELLDLPVDHSTSYTVNNTNTNTNTNSNSSNAGVLTAAGLASGLSMLIPQPEPTPPAKTGVMGPSSGGSFSPAPIQGLNFSSPKLAPIGSSNKIDYVKQIRAGLFKDLV